MASTTNDSKSQVKEWPQNRVWKALLFHPNFPLQRVALLAMGDNEYFEHCVCVHSNQGFDLYMPSLSPPSQP